MPSLSKELRRLLEKTIAGENGARQIAELGAEQSLQRLAVDRHEPHTSLNLEERTLRTQLRAHGRQLGDKRGLQRGSQSIVHLTQAVAYEHWHRLLFARFLAENDLLMHPDHGVALSLDEVKEVSLGVGQDWIDVASEFAQRMLLREVFRSDDPALRVPLSPERRLELERKVNSLPRAIFVADDSLGWVYQFWQKDAKDQVNRSEVKIGADELSPVTQLFTEDFMVLFILENTLGAWWTARSRTSTLPSYQWTYLRLNNDGSPAAGTFDGWPKTAKELKVLDPCMGSGHFLTFALPILVRMRQAEEGLSVAEAAAAVLRDNLFGLELDPRCSQIAAFNLALTAWKLAGQHFELPSLNLACSGIGPNAAKEQWIKLGEEIAARGGMPSNSGLFATEDSLLPGPVKRTMESLHELFSQASVLGSLIDPSRLPTNLFQADFETVAPLLTAVLEVEGAPDEMRERVIAAAGMVKSAVMLASKYTLVVTNVPYVGQKRQAPLLKDFCQRTFPSAKADLATCFVLRSLDLCMDGGTTALVTPHNWLFLGAYKSMRHKLLSEATWHVVARLGARAFETISGEVVNVALVILGRDIPGSSQEMSTFDVSEERDPTSKALSLRGQACRRVSQSQQVANPDSRISFELRSDVPLLSAAAISMRGIVSGDGDRWFRHFWELPSMDPSWRPLQTTVARVTPYGGRSLIINWSDSGAEMLRPGTENRAYGRRGVALGQVGDLPATLYTGELYDNNTGVIVPLSDEDLPALWAFCSSKAFCAEVRKIDQALKVTNATFLKVPFDAVYWKQVAETALPHGLPKPLCNDPTQWLFDANPKGSTAPLQVAVARLVGYQWPRQTGMSFTDCPRLEIDSIEKHAARDGIVCLASIAGEDGAAAQLRALLQTAYGSDYNLSELLSGKHSGTLEGWLTDEFFEEHCQLFQQRPFVWHVWDGMKDGFHAFINYHKLDRRNLEKLIYSYLGDWLSRQRQDLHNGVEGADARFVAAQHLQGELKSILEGQDASKPALPYDIFVRWKPYAEQSLGWAPDLDDGVRMNIRPWITVAKLYKSTKPGILRVTPNIKYTKDRGQEAQRNPNDFPWFDGNSDRINDRHLSLAEKLKARGLE
jgi:hypothetical protein